MTRGVAHPPEVRAEAEELLLEGLSQAEVCRRTGLPAMTVNDLARKLGSRLVEVRTRKKAYDLDLVMDLYRASMRAMIAIATLYADDAYARQYEPDKLAIAFGVMGDKLAGVATTAHALGLIGTPNGQSALAGPDSGNSAGVAPAEASGDA